MDLNRTRRAVGRRIDGFEWPVVVTLREKHSDVRFACLDRAELERACLVVLWERHHSDMGYYDPDPKPAEPPVSREAVAAMPAGGMKEGAEADWKHYKAALGWHRESTAVRELATAALRGRDGALAFRVLEACADREYEGFEVDSPRTIEDPPQVDLLSVRPDWMTT